MFQLAGTEKLRREVNQLQKEKKIVEARNASHKEEYRRRIAKKDQYEKMIKKIANMRQQPELFKQKWESMGEDKRQTLLVEFHRLGL